MEDNNKFTDILDFGPVEDQMQNIIKVVGVGGGGCNAVSRMYDEGIQGVSFAVLNTDSASLKHSPVPVKLQLGSGLGAGARPEIGRQEAENSLDSIERLFDDHTRMVFVTATMGGGTGTGAAPVVARVAKKLNLVQRSGRLLDAAAPGLSLSLAFVRLSELFNNSGRSRITVQKPLFQRLPFAVPVTDSSGAVSWSLAAFFLSFLALLIITVVLVRLYLRYRRFPLVDGSNPNGNVFRLFLLLWGATEVIVDSVRNDSCLMHFTFLKQLNPYASFVSLGQVFAGVTILCVLIRFTVVRVRGRGWSWGLVLGWLLFLASLFGAGFLGEYRVQRTANYALCYAIMAASLILLTAVILLVYRSCIDKNPPEDDFTV